MMKQKENKLNIKKLFLRIDKPINRLQLICFLDQV